MYWNEIRKKKRVEIYTPCRMGWYKVCVLYPFESIEKYEIYIKRWNKWSFPKDYWEVPQCWEQLWPKKEIVADTFLEARKLQLQLIGKLESSLLYSLFINWMYNKRDSSLTCLQTLQLDNGQWARIYQHCDTSLFEVQYFVRESCNHIVNKRWSTCTFAATFEDALSAVKYEAQAVFSSTDTY